MKQDRLTPKETEVLEAFLTCPDLRREGIAGALCMSHKTLDIHIGHLLQKTGYHTMQGLLVELLKDLYAESLAREADGDR